MNTELSRLTVRMKRLSPRHRLAHLRALIRLEPAGSRRGHALVALLVRLLASTAANENRVI